MKREIIVVGDIEMGGGTYTDDFISDNALSTLILKLSRKKHPVDLILNGDTFDFLKCPYIINNKVTYPRHITGEISLAKLRLIYNAHTKVFEALKKFASKEENKIFFIVGNHDADLVYKEVQQGVRTLLENRRNIFFSFTYNRYGVYAEHGHQYDFVNKVNLNLLFHKFGGKPILNIPWVAYGYIHFCSLKEDHPLMERIMPRPVMFSHHKAILKKLNLRVVEYFLKGLFYYPWRYFSDPTYTFPRKLVREFYRRMKNVHWDVDEIVEPFKRKRKKLLEKNKINVLGHVHKRHLEEIGDSVIIHPDTWRDEYYMDTKTRELIPKVKRYLKIEVNEDGSLNWDLVTVPLKRSILHFDDIIRDEKRYVKLAAQEEGYGLEV